MSPDMISTCAALGVMLRPSAQHHSHVPPQVEVTNRPVTEERSFPFLDLPGEIRNMIYEYALLDSHDCIRFLSDNYYSSNSAIRRGYRLLYGPPDRDDLPSGQLHGTLKNDSSYCIDRSVAVARALPPKVVCVALLQTCKQIDHEAAPIFYGKNLFSLNLVCTVRNFLRHFHSRLPLFRLLALHGGTFTTRVADHEEDLAPIFEALSLATSLDRLIVDSQWWYTISKGPKTAADRLYVLAERWIRGAAETRGKALAVLDVMKLPDVEPYMDGNTNWRYWADTVDGQRRFQAELSKKMRRKRSA